ncbi:MAG TPA: OadG family protein [Dissulfurispiraceae bacterium]|nr:OadG family protein [Dissulfurispiraceae bacterium]
MSYLDTFAAAALVMVLGMGVVFFFLATMILCMNAMSRMLAKYAVPEPVAVPQAAAPPHRDEGAVVAAIALAMNRYLNDKKK